MLHRDIKAANLLVNALGDVKLGDLGISIELASTMARRMTVIGTPHWLAPEVIASDAGYGASADVWSLGITAIELAEGCPPYWDVAPVMRALFKISSGPPPTLSRPAQWGAPFASFLACCLQKAPQQRADAVTLTRAPFFARHLSEPLDLRNWLLQVQHLLQPEAAPTLAPPVQPSSAEMG